ncbi:MAG: uncharacterized protein A8A55_1705 [Amphiamblys sp. WSBS2006]|nr:MAG: uncharacterized protein A8A55_1705 [Amphiamblys sp. WSBS2006]
MGGDSDFSDFSCVDITSFSEMKQTEMKQAGTKKDCVVLTDSDENMDLCLEGSFFSSFPDDDTAVEEEVLSPLEEYTSIDDLLQMSGQKYELGVYLVSKYSGVDPPPAKKHRSGGRHFK